MEEKVLDQKKNLFDAELQKKLEAKVSFYETKRAAMLEVLRIVMEEKGHISLEDEKNIGLLLEVPAIDVREVMTFYTLFYDKPRAKTRFNVCRTLACHLNGGNEIIQHLEEKLGIVSGQATKDGKCSLQQVECLGACEIAPMMQVNDHEYVGNLTKEKIDQLIKQHVK